MHLYFLHLEVLPRLITSTMELPHIVFILLPPAASTHESLVMQQTCSTLVVLGFLRALPISLIQTKIQGRETNLQEGQAFAVQLQSHSALPHKTARFPSPPPGVVACMQETKLGMISSQVLCHNQIWSPLQWRWWTRHPQLCPFGVPDGELCLHDDTKEVFSFRSDIQGVTLTFLDVYIPPQPLALRATPQLAWWANVVSQ